MFFSKCSALQLSVSREKSLEYCRFRINSNNYFDLDLIKRIHSEILCLGWLRSPLVWCCGGICLQGEPGGRQLPTALSL